MCRTIEIKSSCPRCKKTIDTKTKKPNILGITLTGIRYPKPFTRYNKTWLCPECRKQADEEWETFMLNGNKKLPTKM